MNVRELGGQLDAWREQTDRRLANLPWWGRPVEVAFRIVTGLISVAFGAVAAAVILPLGFLAAWIGNAILWAPFIGACILLAYLTGSSLENTVLIAWSAFLGGCIVFGGARWAARKARGQAD